MRDPDIPDEITPISREYGFTKPAYNVEEAVEATGLSRTSLWRAEKSGWLIGFSSGRTRLFLGRDLASFMDSIYRATRTREIAKPVTNFGRGRRPRTVEVTATQ